ncbi:fused MFS/spermidine synthase [Methylobacterium sp. 77]|uniref:spermidine synthase n=1 Tax=Methylobacterium sp. 77 TaxID=1101192 RepID=UPI00035D48D0|nr:fused MFS/spermidine synthase [Methylobacterium sp. 77]
MAMVADGAGHSSFSRSSRVAAFLALFVATIFLSALLLFGVQPMFTKMVLPVLGGSPSVWSVAMVFFQALLLAGYAYAHALARYLPLRIAAPLHLAVMGCALAALPIELAAGWGKPPADGEAFWLLGLFLVSVGLPFFALSANGPLLQAWFSRSTHPHARDPYFLYGASNIGSFAALIAYPLAIEPLLPLRDQSRLWMLGFAALAGLIALCAAAAARNAAPRSRIVAGGTVASLSARDVWRQRIGWIALSLVPSGLLVSVTAHISTDVAAAPLLWVAPLALFLLTFVLAFRERMVPSQTVLAGLQVVGSSLALLPMAGALPLGLGLTLHLGLFFVNAMICHGALYRHRPDAERLTEFYLCLSVGGVLGGIFCGLLAPQIFSTVLEYPILLVAALFCRPDFSLTSPAFWRENTRSLATLAGLIGLALLINLTILPRSWLIVSALCLMGAMIAFWRKPQNVALLAMGLALFTATVSGALTSGASVRSFFGVHKLALSADGHFRTLSHGTTLHGAMRIANDDGTPFTGRPEPVTYYTRDGGMGRAIEAVRSRRGGHLDTVAVVGLGAGSLACHAGHAEDWTFLEIDPEVVRIARDPSLFRFLAACAPDARIVLGDARLTLTDEPGGKSLIVVDAFSSDSIPSHLMTREALALYTSKLAPGGALVVHISNRHLELRHILARAAAEQGLVTFVRDGRRFDRIDEQRFHQASIVVAMARDETDLGTLARSGEWTRIEPDMSRRPWSDDFSNIVEAMVDKVRQ